MAIFIHIYSDTIASGDKFEENINDHFRHSSGEDGQEMLALTPILLIGTELAPNFMGSCVRMQNEAQ